MKAAVYFSCTNNKDITINIYKLKLDKTKKFGGLDN